MAKKKGKKRAAVKHAVRHVGRKLRHAGETRPGKIIMHAGIMGATGVATSLVVNNVPKVKDLSAPWKGGIQATAGILAVFFGKKRWMKSAGAGAIVASVFSLARSIGKVDPLAGPGAGRPTLPPEVMQRLIRQGSMSMPAPVSMNRPANVTMNRPANVTMRGGSGWGGASF